MAYALVSGLRVTTKVYAAQCAMIATAYFWGDDVSADIEGSPYDMPLLLAAGYGLSDLKSAIVSAVQEKASELGLTVNSSDIDLASYETG